MRRDRGYVKYCIYMYTFARKNEETDDEDEDRESRRYRPLPLDREMGYMVTLRWNLFMDREWTLHSHITSLNAINCV